MTKREVQKIYLYIFIGGVVAVIYITLFGNHPLLPGVYDWINLASDGKSISWLLFPIPFFPIVFVIAGYLYLNTKKITPSSTICFKFSENFLKN